jgi:hypothetical protein
VISAVIDVLTVLEVTPRGTVTGKTPGGLWIRTDQVRFNGPTIFTTAMGRGRSLLPVHRWGRNEKGPAVIRTFLAPRWCNTRKGATSAFIARNRGLCNE